MTGLVHRDERGDGFVTGLLRHALARQDRDVHGPVLDVGVFALDEDELFVA